MDLLIIAILKILDSIIHTYSSILNYKKKKELASLFKGVSYVFFILIVSKVVANKSIESIIVVGVSSMIGNYCAHILDDYFAKDKRWIFKVTNNQKDIIKEIADKLREENFIVVSKDAYNKKLESTLELSIISETKEQSKKIKDMIPKNGCIVEVYETKLKM